MAKDETEQIHASCIAIDGRGVLLCGPSGSGKSDLALRLIRAGAALVADDRVVLARDGGKLVATAPEALYGLMEVRGLGILRLGARPSAAVAVACDLVDPAAVERLPETRRRSFLGVSIPVFPVAPFEASSVIKVQLALDMADGSIMRADDAN